MSDISTQIVGQAQIIELKAREIPEVSTSSEYWPVNDDVKVVNVSQAGASANTNAIFKASVIEQAVTTPVEQVPVLPTPAKPNFAKIAAVLVGVYTLLK